MPRVTKFWQPKVVLHYWRFSFFFFLPFPFSVLFLGKSWQADTYGQLYRTDYLVTDHLAGKIIYHCLCFY